MPPNSNGTNGHHEFTADDFERPGELDGGLPRAPIVPPGRVVSTNSKGVSVIVPPDRNVGGRPTKRTPEARAKIIAAVRLGSTFKLAAAYGNMSYDSLMEWRKDDKDFDEAVENAVGVAAAQWLNVIESATKIDWRAAAWKLQHRFPTEFGRNVNEVSGPNGGPIPIRELTVRVPDSLGVDDIDEGPPALSAPSGD